MSFIIRNGLRYTVPDVPPPACPHGAGRVLPFALDVGGHRGAGKLNHCAAKAIQIATGTERALVDRQLRLANGCRDCAPAEGWPALAVNRVLVQYGFRYHRVRLAAEPCRGVHLSDLPRGRVVAWLDNHACAVVDGIVRCIFNPSDPGWRALPCVIGFWIKERQA